MRVSLSTGARSGDVIRWKTMLFGPRCHHAALPSSFAKKRFAFRKVELIAAERGRQSVSSLQKHTWTPAMEPPPGRGAGAGVPLAMVSATGTRTSLGLALLGAAVTRTRLVIGFTSVMVVSMVSMVSCGIEVPCLSGSGRFACRPSAVKGL